MIGKIKGRLKEIEGNLSLIETSAGIFYQVYLTPSIAKKYNLDDQIEIYTYLQVKEDGWVLFGFDTKQEYQILKMLLTVSGVGPKTAFTVVSFSKPEDLIHAVKENNIDYFTNIPGLGKKTALKIVLELSQKLETEFEMKNLYLSDEDKTVVDALTTLGFKSHEAKNILNQLPKNLSIEEKIKEALKYSQSSKKKV